MEAKDGVDAGQKERVEEGKVGGGFVGPRCRPPVGGIGKAVSGEHAAGQGIIGALIIGAGENLDGIAQIKSRAQANEEGKGQNKKKIAADRPITEQFTTVLGKVPQKGMAFHRSVTTICSRMTCFPSAA